MSSTSSGSVFHKLNTANLRQRCFSGLILAPLVLLCIYVGGPLFVAVVVGAMTLALYEWLRMVDANTPRSTKRTAFVALAMILAVGVGTSTSFGLYLTVFMTWVVFMLAGRQERPQALWIALGIPYIAGSGLALLSVRLEGEEGLLLTFFLFAVVWATDIGAYLAGVTVGGPKLLPRISPKKTWAGLLGGMGLAAVVGYFFAAGTGAENALLASIVAVVAAVIAQAGDFFESYVKRRAGVKDSGALIPGHGGILDRIDGLLFAALFLALFSVTTRHNWW